MLGLSAGGLCLPTGNGHLGADPHKAGVAGDAVGDPFKDTAEPSLRELIKLAVHGHVCDGAAVFTGISPSNRPHARLHSGPISLSS